MFEIIQLDEKFVVNIFGLKIPIKRNINKISDCCCIGDVDFYIKHNTKFPNPIGIVLPRKMEIGENCTIYQNVTIGYKDKGCPSIGNNVKIYPNAVVFGDITIGDNVIIEAGSVVTKSVPSNCTVMGNPAKIIEQEQ